MRTIKSAKVEQPLAGKNHDGLFFDAERHIYGVFDGADESKGSEFAVASLAEVVQSTPPEDFSIVSALRTVHQSMMRHHKGLVAASCVALADNSSQGSATWHYASAGNSHIYGYDHKKDSLQLHAGNDSYQYKGFIQAGNFLGNPGHTLEQQGDISADKTTLLLTNDGIVNSYLEGHLSSEAIAAILRRCDSVQVMAGMLMDRITVQNDDVAFIVVKTYPG